MVVDCRIYTIRVGMVQTFLDMFQNEGLEPQQRILGNFMGLYRTEIGDVNQIMMMFGYADAGERERRRAALYKDPAPFLTEASAKMAEKAKTSAHPPD